MRCRERFEYLKLSTNPRIGGGGLRFENSNLPHRLEEGTGDTLQMHAFHPVFGYCHSKHPRIVWIDRQRREREVTVTEDCVFPLRHS